MADPENKENIEPMDDTKTRKTVRLQPSAHTPTSIKLPTPAAPLADPLSGRDTDTGNLEVMEDTQTRKTVKLKPIAPPPSTGRVGMINVQAGGPPPAPADGDNTQTRKTVVLKPTAVSPTSVNVAPGAPADAVPSEADDTQTRKTVRIKGSVVPPSALKIGIPLPGSPAPSALSAPAPAGDDEESSDTIKISRPRPGGGMIPPRPPGAPAPGAPASTAQAAPSKATMVLPGVNVQTEDEMPAHSLPAQKPLPDKIIGPEALAAAGGPKPPPRPAAGGVAAPAPKAPAAPAAPSKPKEDDDAAIAVKKVDKPDAAATGPLDEKGKEPKVKSQSVAGQASKLYLVLAVLTLIALIASATYTTVQYLNLHQKQNIELPDVILPPK